MQQRNPKCNNKLPPVPLPSTTPLAPYPASPAQAPPFSPSWFQLSCFSGTVSLVLTPWQRYCLKIYLLLSHEIECAREETSFLKLTFLGFLNQQILKVEAVSNFFLCSFHFNSHSFSNPPFPLSGATLPSLSPQPSAYISKPSKLQQTFSKSHL